MNAVVLAVAVVGLCPDCQYHQASIVTYQDQLNTIVAEVEDLERELATLNSQLSLANQAMSVLLQVPVEDRDDNWNAQMDAVVIYKSGLETSIANIETEIGNRQYAVADLVALIEELQRLMAECGCD